MTEDDKPPPGVLRMKIPEEPGKSQEEMLTDFALLPHHRHALIVKGFAGRSCGDSADYELTAAKLADIAGAVRKGRLDDLTDMLAAQAMTLDTMFSEYSRCAMMNLGHYPDAVDRYMGLALKAQANCRTTVETLARVKRDGKQTVKVIHVSDGGQAVIADTFNQGGSNAGNSDQLHGQGAPGAALSGPDPSRDPLPLPCDPGKEAVPAARRPINRRAKG